VPSEEEGEAPQDKVVGEEKEEEEKEEDCRRVG
jgi:hypothetical protein